MPDQLSRRDFVKVGAAGTAALVLGAATSAPAAQPPMPERLLGRTGRRIRIFGLGGQAALEDPARHDTSLAIVEKAIQLGVNYIDTAPTYGAGESQRVIGEGIQGHRKALFLASKTRDHGSRDGAWKRLEESLRLLRTDHLDL